MRTISFSLAAGVRLVCATLYTGDYKKQAGN